MKVTFVGRVVASLVLLSLTAGCFSQKAPSTDAKMDQILAELKEIKDLLKEGGKGESESLLLADRTEPSLGKPDAPVTIVEFTDYQCPYCRKFHDETFPKLKSQYIDTGKVRFVVRDLPLSFHEYAKPAAIATRCADQQGLYWPVFEKLFNSKVLNQSIINQSLNENHINMALFDQCRKDPKTTAAVDDDLQDAIRLGVDGTPGFIIATRQHGLLSGQLLSGALPLSSFSTIIDGLLKEKK